MNLTVRLLIPFLLITMGCKQSFKDPEGSSESTSQAASSDGSDAMAEESSVSAEDAAIDNGMVVPANSETVLPDGEEFLKVSEAPLSTFSADVDTASYSRFRAGQPWESIRLEEFLNYFPYNYQTPSADEVFSFNFASAPSPWNGEARIARIGIKAYEPDNLQSLRKNLVFLIDVSGSMSSADKIGLLKQSLSMLVNTLAPEDTVAIVTYAGSDRIALYPTPISESATILSAIDGLSSGGSTNGASGIKTAYELANQSFVTGAVNRVFLATDGDFNVGVTNPDELAALILEQSSKGIFLSVLGFGRGGNDYLLEAITGSGNGIYHFIDSMREAEKVFGIDLYKGLVTVAKDLKFQVNFNGDLVDSYRLIGYQNRRLEDEDFDNDEKDAGDIGAGHEMTAIYEFILNEGVVLDADSEAIFTLSTRYKQPEAQESALIETPFVDTGVDQLADNPDFNFQLGLVAYGQMLNSSSHIQNMSLESMSQLVNAGLIGETTVALRSEFAQIMLDR